MRTVKNLPVSMKWKISGFCILTFLASGMILNAQPSGDKGVKLVRVDDKHKVDVYINGNLFTSYQYPENIEKPFLFPVNAPDGSVITRGYPIEPRKGERMLIIHTISESGLTMAMSMDLISGITLQQFQQKRRIYTDISFIRKLLKQKAGRKEFLKYS